MPRLIWSPAALQDMQRLHRFLAEQNGEAAKRAVKAIRAGVTILSQQPGVGRPVEEMASEFREWLIPFGEGGYAALYRYDGETAVILAVRHQKEAGY
jgi:plasmid stabilization system protein ParE